MLRLFLLILAALPLAAGEYAVLASGFRLHVERHERDGEMVRLFTSGGVIELPAAEIRAFEHEDYSPPPAPVLVAAPAVAAVSPEELVREAAKRYGLPEEFLHSVAAVESGYRPEAISPKGAIGIMQLMPGTAAELNADPHDPLQNVDAGARHLRDLLLKYDGGVYRALAAYNAGAGAVSRYDGIPPYKETQDYVQKVFERYKSLSERARGAEAE